MWQGLLEGIADMGEQGQIGDEDPSRDIQSLSEEIGAFRQGESSPLKY